MRLVLTFTPNSSFLYRVALISSREKLRAMEATLAKGKQIQENCSAVINKLQAILHSTEEQLNAHKKQAIYLTQLAAKTLPKGLHCLPLRLTTEFYISNVSQEEFPTQEKLEDPKLYHYALFSDNVLAAAVVVNSTVLHAKVSYMTYTATNEPDQIQVEPKTVLLSVFSTVASNMVSPSKSMNF